MKAARRAVCQYVPVAASPAIYCQHVCRRTITLGERRFAPQLSPDALIFDGLEHLRLEAR